MKQRDKSHKDLRTMREQAQKRKELIRDGCTCNALVAHALTNI